MKHKTPTAKRKIKEIATLALSEENKSESESEASNSSDEDELLNVVNDEENDSSDDSDDSANDPSNSQNVPSDSEHDSTDSENGASNSDDVEEKNDSIITSKNKLFRSKKTKNDSSDSENGSSDSEDEEEKVDSNKTSKNKLFRSKKLVLEKIQMQQQQNEYADHDTSDEEDIRNTIGNVPMTWYDEYKHLGYDWDGKQILKPEAGDQIEDFLKRMEDPDFWRTVKDPQTGQNVVLSEEDISLIRRIQGQRIPDVNFDEYAPWIEWFTNEVMKMPIRKFPEHKRSFLPSKSEARKVSKLVHALKMGWIKTRAEQERLRARKEPQFYMLWQSDDQPEEMRRIHKHIPAPKRHLPGHAESYNPPPEYLFDAKEMKEWEKLEDSPLKRKLHFVPQKYDSLRKVPAYSRYIKERFLRCLDLYLCPRAIKMKLTIEPEDLVPKLPSPKDLQPFPTVLCIQFEGHTDMVRSMTTDKSGQYLATGSDDTTIKIWEINTGRCLKTIKTDGVVRSIKWCPNTSVSLILVASGNRVLLVNPHVGDFVVNSKTDAVLQDAPPQGGEAIVNERVRTCVQWESPTESEYDEGMRIVLKHFKEVAQVTWHGRGDYFATVMPDGQNRSVLISQLSKRRSQLPFSKPKGLVQCVLFHPIRPLLFVATQRNVRIYDLVKQQLVKKLLTGSRWISTMDIHPGGDNLLVGTYDRKVLWFDLDLSTKPYQTLRLHGTAVRGVAFHKRYPLFASGSDDRSLIISHGMVYNDLLKNPLIVPLKRFQDHEQFNDFGIFDVLFHPLQPWVFSSGADGTVKLYSN